MRGEWIARLYQPIFVVYVAYTARILAGVFNQESHRKAFSRAVCSISVAIVVLANASVSFGPILGYDSANLAYYHFYQHSTEDAISQNTEKYGRRPLGFSAAPESRIKARWLFPTSG